MMRHRIIQIATSAVIIPTGPGLDQPLAYQTLFALCEDGSLWSRECMEGGNRWSEIPSPTVEQRRAVEAAR